MYVEAAGTWLYCRQTGSNPVTSCLPVTRDQSGGDNNATNLWSLNQTKELVSPMGELIGS